MAADSPFTVAIRDEGDVTASGKGLMEVILGYDGEFVIDKTKAQDANIHVNIAGTCNCATSHWLPLTAFYIS